MARVVLCIVWFVVALAGVIAAELEYGWRAVPIAHAWHAVAWWLLGMWLWFGTRLIDERRARAREVGR